MTPNGSVTLETVRLIVIDEIRQYDVGNSARHTENSKKLDRILLAILGVLATVVGGIIIELAKR
jgi:hypothetical protein